MATMNQCTMEKMLLTTMGKMADIILASTQAIAVHIIQGTIVIIERVRNLGIKRMNIIHTITMIKRAIMMFIAMVIGRRWSLATTIRCSMDMSRNVHLMLHLSKTQINDMSFTWIPIEKGDIIRKTHIDEIRDNIDYVRDNLAHVSEKNGVCNEADINEHNGENTNYQNSNYSGDKSDDHNGEYSSEKTGHKSGAKSGVLSGHDITVHHGECSGEHSPAHNTSYT